MGRDISIVISAKDNFSTAINTMKNANNSFNKDLTGLSTKLDTLNKKKLSLKIETDKAKTSLKEAEKQFLKTGDAADRLNLELANMEYDNAKRNLNLVSQNAKQAEKDILSLTNAVSKADNKAGSSLGSGLNGDNTSALSKLASAGLAKMVGDTLANTANTLTSSAFGSEVGTMFSSVLGGAVTGAAIGSIISGIGTAVGGVVGGVVGAISGATSIYENKDDAFKSYYQTQYNDVLENQSTKLESGTSIAGSREQNRISFGTLLGGDENAVSFLKDLTQFASKTPFEYDDLTSISKTLLAYGYGQQELLPLLTKVGDAGSALGMSTDDMKNVATALGRMQTTGKTTLEYLNPLLERGIDVWSYLAEASGKTKKEVQQMVSDGLVPGEEAAKAIADYMGFEYAGNMEKQAQTYQGLISTLQDAQAEIDNAMGEGYLEKRKQGLDQEISYLSGNEGLAKAYNQIGEWQASLENLSEQYQRDAITAVMEGTVSNIFNDDIKRRLTQMYQEYKKYASSDSEEAGAQMGALLAEAQAIAQNEYNASEGAQLLLNTNKELANQLKNDAALKNNYWDAGYEMGKQFSKGMASAIFNDSRSNYAPVSAPDRESNDRSGSNKSGSNNGTAPTPAPSPQRANNHAYGINYVPYDGYQAILHEGERVITASENRSKKSTPQISISGNTFVIREEADIDKVSSDVIRKILIAMDLVS